MDKDLLSRLQFRYPFRLYQKQIIEKVKLDEKDNRFHIIAPPGSGKTVVGIELLKRLGKPAVVFAPNTTIQLQWKKQVELFLSKEDKGLINNIVSTDPSDLKLINIFTYQLISTSNQNNEFLNDQAIQIWIYELIENRIVDTKVEAKNRINKLKKNNRKSYSSSLGKYRKIAKTKLLSDSSKNTYSILHKNAQKLINDLAIVGVETIVLDEVHHLLDYWAITIKTLSEKQSNVHLIGLTATPPRSASYKEKENYLSLMGQIDYQIPTPAVVKEGNLAPFQDLLYICEPTKTEKEFINNIQLNFEKFIINLSQTNSFKSFICSNIEKSIEENNWNIFFKKDPLFTIALIKYQLTQEEPISNKVVIIPEMKKDLNFDDWSILLKKYSLNYLKLSKDKTNYAKLDNIKSVLRMFGYVLTESGIKNHRSPTDLILALSKAKNKATINILKKEIENLNQNIRAVVITDFEKMSISSTKKIKDVLDQEAGGAVGIFKSIVSDKITTKLEPILITGTNILVDQDKLPIILKAMKDWIKDNNYDLEIKAESTEFEKIKLITGNGKNWKSSTYVQMVTYLFEKGITKCLVGTRGLIGEGWNTQSLNTLIDLTSVTTNTSTNQIRGRALRLNPLDPRKLANIWYVICLDNTFEKGDQDLKRLIKKHKHFYGIDEQGKIVKGITHIDSTLTFTLTTKSFKDIVSPLINKEMLNRSSKRDLVYKKWRIGESYENLELAGLSLNKRQINLTTSRTIKNTAKNLISSVCQSLLGFSFWYFQNFYKIFDIPILNNYSDKIQKIGLLLFLIAIQAHAGYKLKKLYNNVLTQIPVDSYVKDITKAVVMALSKSKIIKSEIVENDIRVNDGIKGNLNIEMQNVDSDDSKIINRALSDVFSPVTNQRYLVSRNLNRLTLGILTPIWWIAYSFFRLIKRAKPTYHPIPDILAINKKRALIFCKYWRKYVGGGKLVYTRTTKGSEELLYLRQYNNHDFDKMTYETWK